MDIVWSFGVAVDAKRWGRNLLLRVWWSRKLMEEVTMRVGKKRDVLDGDAKR